MKTPSVFRASRFDDRSLIESIVASFYIVDYGFIKQVNADGTINVTHAKQLKTMQGESLPATTTENIEVLTISIKGFALKLDYAKGDKVLLLGLKNYVQKVEEVTQATELKSYMHYSRENLKALPLCVFSDDAKVKVEADKGDLSVTTQNKIKLNGDSKQFVTWAELNKALSDFTDSLTTAMTTTPIAGNGAPQSSWVGMPIDGWSIDIDSAKTTTVVTGG